MGFLYNNSLYFFNYDQHYFTYSFSKNVLQRIDAAVYCDALHDHKSNRLQRLLGMWSRVGLLDPVTQTDVELFIPQLQFSFSPVHECNMRCKYCFADHGQNYKGKERKITTEMVDRILNFVFFVQFPSYTNYRIDFVSGGEPLLNFEIIRYTIEKSKELLADTNKKLAIFLVTNGSINNTEIFEYLDQNNVNIGISIDGHQEVHDRNRRFADGSPSYKVVINTLETIRNLTSSSSRIKDIWGLSVITAESRNLPEIIEHHKDVNIKHMQMELVRAPKDIPFSINRDNLSGLIAEYKSLAEYFMNEINNGSFESMKMILNDNDYFGKLLCRIIDGGRTYFRCTAGIGKFNFDASGNIYPCEFLACNDNYCLGNVDAGLNIDATRQFANEHVDLRPVCKDCWARYICGGDCYSNSLMVNGNIYTPDRCFCELNKQMIEYALALVFALREKGIFEPCKKFVHMRKVLSTAGGYTPAKD